MPSMDAMLKTLYSPADWLTFYKNAWTRNLIACSTDVMSDTMALAANADAETSENVVNEVGQTMLNEHGLPKKKLVRDRLEERKRTVQNAVDILAAIDALIALSPDDLAKQWSPEALAPVAAPETAPVSFTVQKGMQVLHGDKTYAEDTTVDLNPDAQETKDLIAKGIIAPTTANV